MIRLVLAVVAATGLWLQLPPGQIAPGGSVTAECVGGIMRATTDGRYGTLTCEAVATPESTPVFDSPIPTDTPTPEPVTPTPVFDSPLPTPTPESYPSLPPTPCPTGCAFT